MRNDARGTRAARRAGRGAAAVGWGGSIRAGGARARASAAATSKARARRADERATWQAARRGDALGTRVGDGGARLLADADRNSHAPREAGILTSHPPAANRTVTSSLRAACQSPSPRVRRGGRAHRHRAMSPRGTSAAYRLASRPALASTSGRAPARHASRPLLRIPPRPLRLAPRRRATVRRGARCPPPRASAADSSAPTPGEPRPGFTESYSFFNLATAEFPDDWRGPTARVRLRGSPLDVALMAWFSRRRSPPPSTSRPTERLSYDEFIALCFLQMRGRDPDGPARHHDRHHASLMPPRGDKPFRAFPRTRSPSSSTEAITFVFAVDGRPAWRFAPPTRTEGRR